jgi:hypothetical protein
MKGKVLLIVLVAVVATAASVFVGTRAITNAASGGRAAAPSAEETTGEIENTGNEVATLVEDLEQAREAEAVTSKDRDPMTRHVAKPPPPPVTTTTTTTAPRWPSYTVTAVLLDEDPRAFLRSGDQSISVKVGDEINGGRVIAIEPDGVTIEGSAGTKKYPF